MKTLLLFWVLLCTQTLVLAAPTPAIPSAADSAARYKAIIDSMQATLRYQTGRVQLPGDVGELNVPAGFRYLDATQSARVLTTYWNNPNGESLGMLFPIAKGPLDEGSWAFVIEYEPMGYVKDDDADDIDYADLLKDMQSETQDANKERVEGGYEPILLVGWATKPYYDKQLNVLHWAKDVQFGDAAEHTLNYNVRLLGRKGVLNLNAVGGLTQLSEVQGTIPDVIKSVTFSKGLQYADFDPKLDEVAAVGLGGLVAGKILAKVGFFALILKFWKVLLALGAGAWMAVRRFFGTKTDDKPTLSGGAGSDTTPEA